MSDKEIFDGHDASPDGGAQQRAAAPRMVLGSVAAQPGSRPESSGGDRDVTQHFDTIHPLRVLYKRRVLVFAVFAIIALGATIHSFTLVPTFEARVRVLIEHERMNLVKFQDVMEQDRTSSAYYQTQFMILQSRFLARRTLKALKAANQLEATAAERPEPPLTLSNALSKAKQAVLSVFRDTTHQAAAPEPARPAAAGTAAEASKWEPSDGEVDAFLGGLTVTPVPQSRLVDVKYRSRVPALASRYANMLVEQYIDQNLEAKFLATKQASDWLVNRLSDQRQKVQEAELALQRYRERTGVTTVSADAATLSKLDSLATAITNARTLRIEKESQYKQASAVQKMQSSLDTIPAVISNQYVQQLNSEITQLQGKLYELTQSEGKLDKHPDVVSTKNLIQQAENKRQAEVNKVVESLRAGFVAAEASERNLEAAFESQKREAVALNRTGIELAILQREADSHRQIWEMLTQRLKETDLTSDIKTNNIRVIDPAELPRAPRGADRMAEIRSGVLWGLVLGIAFAFVVEFLDSRIKTGEELSSLIDAPFMGMLPLAPGKNTTLMLQDEPNGHFAEAFRTVRTNLMFSVFEPGSRTLLVTSAGKGEGKTAVATNLAVLIAQMGQRVLLIDADMRRPRVHTVFGRPAAPGLSNLLAASVKANEAVLTTTTPGLWIIPAGTTPPNPAELLASDRFRSLMRSVEQRFDWVIIDSPPMLPVTDAAVIAHESAGTLFVVAADSTTRHAAASALSRLQAVGARIAGTVLNRVDVVRHPYYYPSAYRKSYGEYYAKASNS